MQPKAKNNCAALHAWARSLKRHTFPFDESLLPHDGIYLLFEKGEKSHGNERVVRVGTHTGVGQLRSRLRQHFVVENKDRSIFRKNIGRALLNKRGDAYASVWELDMTPAAARKLNGHKLNAAKQARVERQVTAYLQKNFSFAVVEVPSKAKRLQLESKIISTLSHCNECVGSALWLGNHSPKEKIRQSGLWLVNELYKKPISAADLVYLQGLKK
jgi:hypothetical protein